MNRTTLFRNSIRRGGGAGSTPPAEVLLYKSDFFNYRIKNAVVDNYVGTRPDQLYLAGATDVKGGAVQGAFPPGDVLWAFPYIFPKSTVIRDLILGCGVVGGDVGVGLYRTLGPYELYPGELLSQGHFVTNNLGLTRYTANINKPVGPGLYWFVAVNDPTLHGDCGMWTVTSDSLWGVLGWRSDFSVEPTAPAPGVGWSHPYSYLAEGLVLPDPFPTATPAMVYANSTISRVPAIFFRLGSI